MPKQLPVLTLIYEKWEDLTYVIVSLLFQKVPLVQMSSCTALT